jgi:hypothetical protein
VVLWFQRECSKGLFVLGNVLPQHIPQGLGLLRTQENGSVIPDVYLIGRLAGCQSEHKLEIPYADAHLDAVGIGFAEIFGLGEIDLRLRSWTHNSTRLLRQGYGTHGRVVPDTKASGFVSYYDATPSIQDYARYPCN